MKEQKQSGVPEQKAGSSSDTEACTECENAEAAKAFYQTVRARLLHVNNWQKLAGAATAAFQLTDALGGHVNRPVQEGDYLKIDVPGPGSTLGDGFDWVQVEHISEDSSEALQQIVLQVRPAPNPTKTGADVAHFFGPEATSRFVVSRQGNVVTAGVHGRNEKPNTGGENLLDKVRHSAIATSAIAALAKLQWHSLVKGLVKKDELD